MKKRNVGTAWKGNFSAVLMLAIVIGLGCEIVNAQPGPGPLPGRPRQEGLVALTNLAGQVGEFTTNEDMVYDGFNLTANGTTYLVKFPAHLGSQVISIAKKGAAVSVSGTQEFSPAGLNEFRMVSMVSGGKSITDVPPAFESTPPAEAFVSKSGKVESFLYDMEGRTNGIRLAGNVILRVPPHIGYQLSSQVKAGDTVEASGMLKAKRNGEATVGNYSIIHCQTLSFNGQQYAVR